MTNDKIKNCLHKEIFGRMVADNKMERVCHNCKKIMGYVNLKSSGIMIDKNNQLDKFAEEVRKLDLNCGGGCCQANGELNEGVNKLLEKHKQ